MEVREHQHDETAIGHFVIAWFAAGALRLRGHYTYTGARS